MRGYELTERGKIILAVLLVLILLVLPSTIIALKSVAAYIPAANTPVGEVTADAPPSADAVAEPPSGAAEPPDEPPDSPLSDAPPSAVAETAPPGEDDPSAEVAEPPAIAPGSFLDGGKLSFIFSPANQTALDEATDSLLDAFLEIPDYLPDYVIVAETGQISETAADALMGAVGNALKKRGADAKLEHLSFPPAVVDGNIEVSMYFVSKWTK